VRDSQESELLFCPPHRHSTRNVLCREWICDFDEWSLTRYASTFEGANSLRI
jgi:hypothetical protein